ncbi:MAG: FAD-dependent oxidoreductase [Planctomycetota bacterium]|jgi:succinate dehydrogenase/fumarate reductase flavoprotein subunit|nr:flavoprotein [Deltaproteobacteria bacterium]MDP6540805.1 FAD-dependent oxidoreductase [Planctomycetota bacterium]
MSDTQPPENAPVPEARVPHYDEEADVVVVGLGCAGASAAIEAARSGVDTLVLERAGGGGGTSANSGGLLYLGGGTPLQTALGFEDDPEAMHRYLMAACGPEPDEALVTPYCEHSVEHYHWLVELGLPFKEAFFPDAHEPPGDESLTYSGSEEAWPFRDLARPAPRGHCASVRGPKGPLLMQTLLAGAAAAGARIQTGALARGLVQASDGRIVGLALRVEGERRFVRARRGVVLTAGGFIHDEAMLARYAPDLARCRYKVGTEGDDGSGIRMAAAAGAATLRMDAGDVTLPLFPPVVLKEAVFVNGFGQRFVNEDAYMGRTGELGLFHQDGQVYALVDEGCFEQPANAPVEVAAVGESWPELERELGMASGSLEATMSLYNQHAAAGEDPVFHKQHRFVRPLDRPPFGVLDLRVENSLYAAFTLGGLWIDADGAVQTPAGEPIPGLRAAGRTTSGVAKQGYSSGLSLGDASFFGRRAGRAAARSG